MIKFYVNNEEIKVQLEEEKTVGDVLKSFEQTCEENRAAVIGILVDGKQITADIFDAEASKPLGQDTKFEFSVVTVQIIKDAFKNLSELFEMLSDKMEQIPLDLQSGKNLQVTQSIKTLADSIEQFSHVATLASLFPEDFTETNIDGQNFNDFFADFSPILKDFEQALISNDTVMIGDLSEYEICPRLKAISAALQKM